MSMEGPSEKVLRRKFSEFSKYNCKDEESNGLSMSQLDMWLRQAKILDMKRITTTDTGILFFTFGSRTINFQQFLQFLRDLVSGNGDMLVDTLKKLENCDESMNVDITDTDTNLHTFSANRPKANRPIRQKYLSDLIKDI